MDFGLEILAHFAVKPSPASQSRDFPASAVPIAKCSCRNSESSAARSRLCGFPALQILSVTFPTPESCEWSSGARNRASSPGSTHRTHRLGLIGSDLWRHPCCGDTYGTINPVSFFTALWSEFAARSGGPCKRSVPVTSKYASSTDAISTCGEKLLSTV